MLAALRRSGAPYELAPTRLFEITMLSSGGMTARLDRLERQGLIERRPRRRARGPAVQNELARADAVLDANGARADSPC